MEPSHVFGSDACSTCGQEVWLLSVGRAIEAQHVLGEQEHSAATTRGDDLEVLVRRMRVFIMAAQIGGPDVLLGAALDPVRKQMDAVYSDLGDRRGSYVPAVTGHLSSPMVDVLTADVNIPDDLAGMG